MRLTFTTYFLFLILPLFSQYIPYEISSDKWVLLEVQDMDKTPFVKEDLVYKYSFIQIDAFGTERTKKDLEKLQTIVKLPLKQVQIENKFHVFSIHNFNKNFALEYYLKEKERIKKIYNPPVHKEIYTIPQRDKIILTDKGGKTIYNENIWSKTKFYRIQLYSLKEILDPQVKIKLENMIGLKLDVERKGVFFRYLIDNFHEKKSDAELLIEKCKLLNLGNKPIIVGYDTNKIRLTE